MMKIPVSVNDLGFVFGMAVFAYGLYCWHRQIAYVVVGVLIMLLSLWGAIGEKSDAGNTS